MYKIDSLHMYLYIFSIYRYICLTTYICVAVSALEP